MNGTLTATENIIMNRSLTPVVHGTTKFNVYTPLMPLFLEYQVLQVIQPYWVH